MVGHRFKAILAIAVTLVVQTTPTSALASSDYVIHETRASTGTGQLNSGRHWKRGSRLNSNAIVPLRIGLTQNNLHLGHDKLMDVADPSSANFGKHLSEQDVHALFAPADETFNAVHSWLVDDMGINATDIRQYANKGWLAIDLPVSKVEEMFRTQYHEYENKGVLRIGSDQYSVPKHLAEHIDYAIPGVKLSAPMLKRRTAQPHSRQRKRDLLDIVLSVDAPWTQSPHDPKLPPNLQECATNFTATCYRALYQIPFGNPPVPGHECAVFEYGGSYAQEDLDAYYDKYAPYIRNGTHPKLVSVDGGEAPVPVTSPLNNGESDVDIDIIQSLIWPQSMILYQVDDGLYSSSGDLNGFLNTFLDALDGSYCHSTAYGITGDSPGVDPVYPDTRPGGYNKSEMCGTYQPAKVISISIGEAEHDVPKKYFQRQCNEWLKLGLQGTTVLVASGDYGVGLTRTSPTTCLDGSGQNQTIYNPGNPVSCPYLTAVGGTQLQPNTTILDGESSMRVNNTGNEQYIGSSGGFSNYYPAPDYQKSAIAKYFAKHDPGHPFYVANEEASNIGENGGIYNRIGRGIPDVSANGVNFRLFEGGKLTRSLGTSLAAPLWAAIITLINQERARVGKRSVGFINPVLYANPCALTDITKGSNENCGSSGFSAVEGWDPVTGLGTPKYPELLKLWLQLP